MTMDPTKVFEDLRLPYPNEGIIGHRGLAAEAPENSESSFRAAARAGRNWVEFDIQRCASGEWVVFHDEMMERTSNGHGPLQNKTLTELKGLDIGSWFDPPFPGERILTLEEVLHLLASLGLHPNVEAKFPDICTGIDMAQMAAEVGSIIQEHWRDQARAPAMISSFNLDFLQAFRQRYPNWPMGYLVEDLNAEGLDVAQETAQASHFNTLGVDKDSLLTHYKHARKRDLPLLAFTVDDAFTAIKLFEEYGVSAIFSNKAAL